MTENVHGLLGAYAVDAVTPEERAAFEEHLPACEECALELGSLLETAATLGAAEAATPPASLRASVMEQVGRTAQLPPVGGDDALVAQAPASRERERDARAPRRRVWPRLAVAAASAIALVSVGIAGGSILADREADLALEKDVMMVASAPDAHSLDLALGAAHLVMSEKMHSVAAMGDDCPTPKDGMEYQLWVVMEDGSKHAGPTFMPDDDGTFMALMDMEMEGAVAIAVTEEPMGGSDQPTSTEVAVVDL